MRTIILAALLVLGTALLGPAYAHAEDECPAVPVDGRGVERIEGQGSYSFYGIPTEIVDQPWTAAADTDPDAIMLDVSPDVRKASDLETDAGNWSVYAAKLGDGAKASYHVYGVLVRDGQPYVVTATTPDENLVPLIVE